MPSYLSYSQLALYLECPLKYKLRYLEEGGYGDEQTPAALAFGSAIHQALAHFYREAMDGEPFSLAGFLAVFAAAWEAEVEKQEIQYGEKEDFASLLALGQEMLKVFARSAHPLRVVAVEVPFEFKLEHPLDCGPQDRWPGLLRATGGRRSADAHLRGGRETTGCGRGAGGADAV